MKLVLPLLVSLTACQTPAPEVRSTQDHCGAAGYAHLVGQSSDIFASMTFPAPMRIIKHGMPVTLDYSATRLNFDLDKTQKIARVWCG